MPKVLKTTETPNPQARRFHLDTPVVRDGSRDFPTVELAQDHSLAARLFELPYVASVFFLGSTITVTKEPEASWEMMISPVADCIEAHREWNLFPHPLTPPSSQSNALAGSESHPISSAAIPDARVNYIALEASSQREWVQSILDKVIRPGLQGDGGDLELVACDSHNVVVRYAGACGSCPTSTTGTLGFIESVLREKIHPDLSVHLA